MGTFFEARAEEAEGFEGGEAGGAVVEVEMGVDGVQPAGGVLNDVVGVQVEDIDFAEEVVIEDKIAAEGSWSGIAQVLAGEAGFEGCPLGMDTVDVGLREDDLKPSALHHAAEQLDFVVEEVVGEQLIAQVVEKGLRGEFSGIGDLEDEVPVRQKGHAMLLAALQGIVSQDLLHFID